ncbi:MAG TPA: aspartate aminotransferase family protein [bacterium]|nr:aspartate aminotransferase family protein [bacterium]HQJ65341.1 aspartate aminotransferase family protein [bacterium]
MDKSTFDQYVLQTYKRVPLTLVKGEGMRVWDDAGNEYLDFFPGWGAGNLGHCHPSVVAAVRAQAEKIMHIPNVYYNELQGKLAQLLVASSFDGQVFFCNSGAEANEGAIKLARKRDATKKTIITLKDSFHGRTLATLAATGQPEYQQGFDPLPAGFVYSEPNDVPMLERLMDTEVAAVLLEPVLGEGGVLPLTPAYLRAARTLCDRFGALLILDEVQTGIGRTGRMFAWQHYGVVPDVLTLAKSLGGGMAIGAFVVGRAHCGILGPGSHGSTFGGNPMACAAGVAVLQTIAAEGLLDRAAKTGALLQAGLLRLAQRHALIAEVRGLGMMWGVVLKGEGAEVVMRCREKGVLINCTHGNVLRLMPAITATEGEIAQAITVLDEVLGELPQA